MSNNGNNILGKNIKELRIKANFSQEELSTACNITQPTLCRIEKGGDLMSVSLIKSIASSLGVKPYELFLDKTDKSFFEAVHSFNLHERHLYLKLRELPEDVRNDLIKGFSHLVAVNISQQRK